MTTDKPLLLECPLVEKWRKGIVRAENNLNMQLHGGRWTATLCADELESWLTSREAVWKEVVGLIEKWQEESKLSSAHWARGKEQAANELSAVLAKLQAISAKEGPKITVASDPK
jgi:hypothetical protein